MLPWELEEAGKCWDEYVNKSIQGSGISKNMKGWSCCKEIFSDYEKDVMQAARNGSTFTFKERVFRLIKLCACAYCEGINGALFFDVLNAENININLIQLSLKANGEVDKDLMFKFIVLMNKFYAEGCFCECKKDFWKSAKQ